MIYLKLLFILIIFYILNNYLNINENYTGFKTPLFFDELNKNNYHIDKDKTIKKCDSNNKCEYSNYSYHFNKPESVKLVKNKIKTSDLLKKHNIPIPKFNDIDINKRAVQIMDKNKEHFIEYPIIVKPINGTFGREVHINIENNNELQEILEKIKLSQYKQFMCEEYIEGHVYRIFVFKNKIIDIIKREKPFVIGNGICNLKTLIDKKNDDLRNSKLYPIKNISAKCLLNQNVNMDTIIPKQQKIYVTDIINLHNGAPIERMDMNKVPKINLELFKKVGQVLDINCYGLDYISKNIYTPYNQGKNVILEVNGTPDTEIHTKLNNYGSSFFNSIIKYIF